MKHSLHAQNIVYEIYVNFEISKTYPRTSFWMPIFIIQWLRLGGMKKENFFRFYFEVFADYKSSFNHAIL